MGGAYPPLKMAANQLMVSGRIDAHVPEPPFAKKQDKHQERPREHKMDRIRGRLERREGNCLAKERERIRILKTVTKAMSELECQVKGPCGAPDALRHVGCKGTLAMRHSKYETCEYERNILTS
jgi:hypothetical protein